jgi:hypothetical protein
VVEKRDEELKDREAYIRRLEETLRQQHIVPSRKNSATPILLEPNITDITLDAEPMSPASTNLLNNLQNTLAILERDPVPDEETRVRVDSLLR